MDEIALTLEVDPSRLEETVRTCAHFQFGGRVISVAHAIEEFRIQTGDFLNTDRALADLISATALKNGYAVMLDEAVGPGSTI